MEWIDLGIMAAKVGFVLVLLLQIPPIMVWVERRGSALMQNRLGPNRFGPLGLLQSLADAIKFIFKEDRPPGSVRTFYWFIAPMVAVVPAFMAFAAMPFASSLTLPSGKEIQFQIAQLDVGILYILAIGSLAVYSIIMAGWASNSKYALFGSLRSTSQMISYELSLGLSLVGVLMTFSTLQLGEIVQLQSQTLIHLGPVTIPKYGIFVQPLGFLIFLVSVFAETNRHPFDLPEGESELVAGFHLEYGAMKFALFFLAEYVHMAMASCLIVTMYFGGYQLLPGMPALLNSLGLEGFSYDRARIFFEFGSFSTKVALFMWFFVWVRWTLPRFRYDQLMQLGWRVMLPLALVNILITGYLVFEGVI